MSRNPQRSRLIFGCICAAILVASGLMPARVDANDATTYTKIEGGIPFEPRSGVLYQASYDTSVYCVPFAPSPPTRFFSLERCLSDKSLNLEITNMLAPCDTEVSLPCIENIFKKNESQGWSPGVYVGETKFQRWSFLKFGPFPQYNTGIAYQGNFYTFPAIDGDSDDLYAVMPSFTQWVKRNTQWEGEGTEDAHLSMTIRAVKKIEGKEFKYLPPFNDDPECNAVNLLTECWRYTSNPMTNQFKVILRLPGITTNWRARVFQPDVKIERVKGGRQPIRLIVTGSPMSTPVLKVLLDNSISADQAECKQFLKFSNRVGTGLCESKNVFLSISPNDPENTAKVLRAMPRLDIATDTIDEWSIDTYIFSRKQPCVDEFTAPIIASSNAMSYSQFPIFSKNDQSFDYMVAGPHLNPDGSIFRGVFSMLISKDYLKCFYPSVPTTFKVSLTVIEQDGQSVNAVTVLGADDKYLRLSATNFTYSKKIIRVKFENGTARNTSPKKVIVCVKGTVVRQLTGASTCPKGFKIKK